MAKLASPNITLNFTELGSSFVKRGSRGIVALGLKDTKQQNFTVYDVTDIPTGLSADNVQYIKDALKGYSFAPKKVIVYVMAVTKDNLDTEYTNMLKFFSNEKFTYLAIPTISTDAKGEAVSSWVKTERDNNHHKVKAVLANLDADSEGVINFTTALKRSATVIVSAEQACSRIAGLLAGTNETISATYAPLNDFVDVATRQSKEEMDNAVGNGQLIAFWDGDEVKLNRAVTSFTTETDDKKEKFKKIKLVEDMDIIYTDIYETIKDNYIGKYVNNYDNKCVLITAINSYFQQLANDNIIGAGSAEVDIDAQKAYLKSLGSSLKFSGNDTRVVELSDATDDDFKMANTGSKVFLKATVSLLDAVEDVAMNINV